MAALSKSWLMVSDALSSEAGSALDVPRTARMIAGCKLFSVTNRR